SPAGARSRASGAPRSVRTRRGWPRGEGGAARHRPAGPARGRRGSRVCSAPSWRPRKRAYASRGEAPARAGRYKLVGRMSDPPRTSTRPTLASPLPSSPAPGRPSSLPPPGEYEFSEAHKEALAALAASTSFVGVCVMLLGMMSGVFALGAGYGGFLAVAVG